MYNVRLHGEIKQYFPDTFSNAHPPIWAWKLVIFLSFFSRKYQPLINAHQSIKKKKKKKKCYYFLLFRRI